MIAAVRAGYRGLDETEIWDSRQTPKPYDAFMRVESVGYGDVVVLSDRRAA